MVKPCAVQLEYVKKADGNLTAYLLRSDAYIGKCFSFCTSDRKYYPSRVGKYLYQNIEGKQKII